MWQFHGLFLLLFTNVTLADESQFFEIRVVDRSTARGIPMVTLTTVDDVRYVTDNAGRIALFEPELEDQTVFFSVRSPGYTMTADGFGIEGVRVRVNAGKAFTVTIDRTNIAERLYRVTGRNRYVDSLRLGYDVPIKQPVISGGVIGQDSVQAAVYNNQVQWFWGDTNRLSYPLGLFRTAGATSALPQDSGVKHSLGINFKYFCDETGFARRMVDVPEKEGVVWIDGVCVVPDESGQARLVAHFSRRKGLAEQLEHGLLIYNDERQMFEVATKLNNDDRWRFVRDHPTQFTDEDGIEYLIFGNPFPVTRVRATLSAVLDPTAYDSFSCVLKENKPNWQWQKTVPTTQHDEWEWVKASDLDTSDARYLPFPIDGASHPAGAPKDRPVLLHSGTVHFNAFRDKWVMIAVQQASTSEAPSYLGEVWYSEADTPQGPFRTAVRIATHPKQTFYNPVDHPFFDAENGRFIYFEGTYCNTFTTSPATPLYNYNQMMYRLDLSDSRIQNPSTPRD